MRSLLLSSLSVLLAFAAAAQAPHPGSTVRVPEAPPAGAHPVPVHDRHFGVRFEVPPGWSFYRRDGQVSTFHLDAKSAPRGTQLRGVANIEFNPYPYSTFSGAIFYFSVLPHTTDAACAREASGMRPDRTPLGDKDDDRRPDVQQIGGMSFVHGHAEEGRSCVEQRDEIYTAYRRGACYRFDLAINTFCGAPVGIPEVTGTQLEQIDARMAGILSTVALDWSRSGPEHVQTPRLPEPAPPPKDAPTLSGQATGQ